VRKALLIIAFLLPAYLPQGAQGQALEHEVKAAYLYRFLSFVEWPSASFARPDSPIVIGVLGADDVLEELRAIVPGRVVQGRPVAVRRVQDASGAGGAHLLYFGRGTSAQLDRLPALRGQLVVTDWSGGLDQGAVVNFVRSEGRLRFEVAVDAAARRELKISSRMLAVASSVRQGKL
jgi:YfiR/HmsC-like